jgi:zinc protease
MKPIGVARLLFLASFLAIAPAQQIEVSEHELDNGLRILVHEDHDIPNVALYFFYRIGARNERPGITGISHFFEHMMFNGAKKFGPKQFDIVMEKNGGANNAYTSRDITVYTDWFPKAALELMFEMESDRMADLQFDPKIVESERGVVANERRMGVDNSNRGTLYEQMNAAAFTAHPYGWPVIGWASDIQAWSVDDLKGHYRMGYAPNNCTMVVTGDVTAAEVLALARKYIGPIPRQDPPPAVRTTEPPQQGERRVAVYKQAQLPMLLVAFHSPETRHADYLPLTVLGSILADGRSSRLYRRLVDREQLTLSVDQDYSYAIDPTLFFFTLQPRGGVETGTVERALAEELDRIAEEGVTEGELEKAKNIHLVDLYRDLQTIAGKANLLGRADVFQGDYRKLFTMREDLEKITLADVQRVAKTYFGARNRTVATLLPEKEGAE